jgi:hypothetical protein
MWRWHPSCAWRLTSCSQRWPSFSLAPIGPTSVARVVSGVARIKRRALINGPQCNVAPNTLEDTSSFVPQILTASSRSSE